MARHPATSRIGSLTRWAYGAGRQSRTWRQGLVFDIKIFCAWTDLQPNAIHMNELELRVRRPLKSFTEDDWKDWTSEPKVIADMLRHSGMQDKSIAIETGIDPAILSKTQSGSARLKEADMDALMDACGSEAWLHYWCLKRGYDPRSLRRIETVLEAKVRRLEEKLAQVEQEREIEVRLFRNLRSPA